MIKETGSNYAYKVKHTKDFSFNTMMSLARAFVNSLEECQTQELFAGLNHGVDLLYTEPLMNMYLYAFGSMHEAKLKLAFDNMGEEYKQYKDFAIVDYGCGQGLATIVLYDYLKTLGLGEFVRKIVLIEPSKPTLMRAALNVSVAFPQAERITVNKFLDNITVSDIACDNTMVFHLFSNILDVKSFSIEHLASVVNENKIQKKCIICTCPYLGGLERNNRIDEFCYRLGVKPLFVCSKLKGEWVKDWSCKIRVIVSNLQSSTDVAISKVRAFNRMSAKAFKECQGGAPIQFIENPRNGKIYFKCGNITGYCSPAVQKAYKTTTIEELQFAEVAKDGHPANAVPCLMLMNRKRE